VLDDLDDSLKLLLLDELGISSSKLDISFEIPTGEWSAPVNRPTINLYLYNLRENTELREMEWTQVPDPSNPRRTVMKRRPLRVSLSYMVTCWTSAIEDQHRLLWAVFEALFRNPVLPDEARRGRLKSHKKPIKLEISPSTDVIKNVTDYWTSIGNEIRPAVNLVVTLAMDLQQTQSEPLVLSRVLRQGLTTAGGAMETGNVLLGGTTRFQGGAPAPRVAVRVLRADPGEAPRQIGPSELTDQDGRFRLGPLPLGQYTVVAELPERAPHQQNFQLEVKGEGPLSPFSIDIDLPWESR